MSYTLPEIINFRYTHELVYTTMISMTVIDTDYGVSKVYADYLPKFSGKSVDHEEWERNIGVDIFTMYINRTYCRLWN